jgi:hypothetical protein
LVAKKDYFLENERKKFNREKKNQLKMIEMSLVSDDECD